MRLKPFLPLGTASARLTWGLAVAQLVAWGIVYYSFAVFLVPMEEELGWSRASLTAALALGLVTAGLAAPFVGSWIDRRGGRHVMSAGTMLAAAMIASWAWMPSYTIFCLSWVGIGLAQAMTLYEPAFAVLHRELGPDAPPAIARVTLMGGLASTCFVPLTYWLITLLGWRSAALVLAALVLLLCAPIFWRLPHQSRGPLRAAGSGRAPLRAAVRKPAFWALLVTYAASALAFGAMTFHIIPLLLERGLTEAVAIAIVTAIGPLQVAGRLGILLLWRDVSARTLGRIITSGFPVALLILIFTSGLAGALAFAILYGVCNGLATILRGIAAAEFLGRDGFGAINGMLTTPASFAKAAAPALAGAMWAATGNYAALLWLLFAAATLAAIGFWIASASRADGSATERPARVRG